MPETDPDRSVATFGLRLAIVLVLTMNIIEQIFAVDLLPWGRLNLVFALGFAGIVYWQAFRGRATKAG